jgi:hypothetical protein
MTRRPAQPGGHPYFDEVTAERLLRGQRPAPGAPSAEQVISELLAAASASPSASELSGEPRATAAFAASRPATTAPRHARHAIRRRRPAVGPRVSHGLAAAAALGALTVGGMAAAAYTGSLPSSIQKLAHDHIGAPHGRSPHPQPASTTSRRSKTTATALRSGGAGNSGQPGLSAVTPTPRPTPSGPGRRPAATSAASRTLSVASQRDELCAAYLQALRSGDKSAMDNALRPLEKAAGGHDNVTAYCAPVWPSGAITSQAHDSGYPHQLPTRTVSESSQSPSGRQPS